MKPQKHSRQRSGFSRTQSLAAYDLPPTPNSYRNSPTYVKLMSLPLASTVASTFPVGYDFDTPSNLTVLSVGLPTTVYVALSLAANFVGILYGLAGVQPEPVYTPLPPPIVHG